MREEKVFKLRGKTLVIIDWANVYGWFKTLKWEIKATKLYNYLKSYPQIYEIRLYFGVDPENPKSLRLHKNFKKIGYRLCWKKVKWIPVEFKFLYYQEKGKIKKLLDSKQGRKIYEKFLKVKQIIKDLQLCRRKCDFDVEITMDVLLRLQEFDGLILFSGDGDFKPLCEYLLDHKKQVIIVHPYGHRGREFNELLERKKNKPFFYPVEKLKSFLK